MAGSPTKHKCLLYTRKSYILTLLLGRLKAVGRACRSVAGISDHLACIIAGRHAAGYVVHYPKALSGQHGGRTCGIVNGLLYVYITF